MMLAIALLFALLQPFLHIHLDTEHPIQQTGFHVANAYEEMHDYALHMDEEHVLKGSTHTSEVIAIDAATKQEVEHQFSADGSSIILLIFCIGLLSTTITTSRTQPRQQHFYRLLRQQLPASRAPPQH